MLELLKKRIKNEKGLSLVELLAVIVILAIVAAIAIPAIGNIIENSRYSGVKSDAVNVLTAANLYFTDENKGENDTVTVGTLKTKGYLESQGKLVDTDTITKKAGGNTLKAAAITFSGSKTLEFDGATVKGINTDNTKGSEVTSAGKKISN